MLHKDKSWHPREMLGAYLGTGTALPIHFRLLQNHCSVQKYQLISMMLITDIFFLILKDR